MLPPLPQVRSGAGTQPLAYTILYILALSHPSIESSSQLLLPNPTHITPVFMIFISLLRYNLRPNNRNICVFLLKKSKQTGGTEVKVVLLQVVTQVHHSYDIISSTRWKQDLFHPAGAQRGKVK